MKQIIKSVLILITIILINPVILNAQIFPAKWTDDTDITLIQEDTILNNGSKSLLVIVNSGNQSNCDIRSEEFPVVEGELYFLSFYYNSSEHVRIRGVLEWTGASITYSSNYGGDGVDDQDYQLFTFEGTVPAGATSVKAGIRFYDQTGFSPGEIQYIDLITFNYRPDGENLIFNGGFEYWQKKGWIELKEITASDGYNGNVFGYSAALSGSYAAVAAHSDGLAGAVYILGKNQGGTDQWGEVKKFKSNDITNYDEFGTSVDLEGNTVVVGAIGEDLDAAGGNKISYAGAAYVFRKDFGGPDNWGQVKKLVPDIRYETAFVGKSVSIYDTIIVVGAKMNDYSGEAYIFTQNTGGAENWGLVKTLTGSNPVTDNMFGFSVKVQDTIIVVGAPGENNDQGAVYIFTMNTGGPGNWGEYLRITSDDPVDDAEFGSSVDLENDKLVVGAPGIHTVYVFHRNLGGENNWGLVKKIGTQNPQWGFGIDVGISGENILVGDHSHNGGRASFFSQHAGGMNNYGFMGDFSDFSVNYYSKSLDISGDIAIIGSQEISNPTGEGKAWIYGTGIQAGSIEIKDKTQDQATISWIRGDGDSVVVFVDENSWSDFFPDNNTTFAADTVFGQGTYGSGYCVYNGSGTSVTVTGLPNVSQYVVKVIEYNGGVGSEFYYDFEAPGYITSFFPLFDLSAVTINVKNMWLANTYPDMEYSLNSTDGIDGEWFPCDWDGTYDVQFTPGKVFIRQISVPDNFHMVYEVPPAPAAPDFTTDYFNERSAEILNDSIEYNTDPGFGYPKKYGIGVPLDLTPGEDVYLRMDATDTTLLGAVQHLVVNVRPVAPDFSIDFHQETTMENGDTIYEYSINSDLAGATTGTGMPFLLDPEADRYFRLRATDTSFTGHIQELVIPARPDTTDYSTDYFTESTAETVLPSDEYTNDPNFDTSAAGTGLKVVLLPGMDTYFRTISTDTTFSGAIQHLVIPERSVAPIVSLSDKNSGTARFKKSADGSGSDVSLIDEMEFSFDYGNSWTTITDVTTADAEKMKFCIVREKATTSSFASFATGNLDYEIPVITLVVDSSCNGPGNSVTVQSNLDNGAVYLVPEDLTQDNIAEIEAAVDASQAVSVEVTTPFADIIVPANSLSPGTYNAYTTNDWDSLSAMSTSAIEIFGVPEVDLGEDIVKCQGTEVTLDAGTGFSDYLWSFQEETSQAIQVSVEGDYIVSVTDENNCTNSDTIIVRTNIPYPDEQLCIVTIDLATANNLIVWEKTPDKGIIAYNLYRETTIGAYDLIGTVPVTGLSIFLDSVADPESQTYLYKITSVDSCNNESELDDNNYHKPIFLQYVSSEGGVNLEWTDYEIENVDDIKTYLTSFVIYRGTDSTGLSEYKTLGSINNYTDIDPNALEKKYFYRVAGILTDPCTPSVGKKADAGPYSHSMSNIEDNRLQVGINNEVSESLLIYPNPFSEYAIIRFPNPNHSVCRITVTDITGRVVEEKFNITGDEVILYRNQLNAGLYHVEIIGDKYFSGRIIIE